MLQENKGPALQKYAQSKYFVLFCILTLLLSMPPLYAAETQTPSSKNTTVADKQLIAQIDTITSHTNSVTNAATDIGGQVEQFKKGRNQDTNAIESKNTAAGKINEMVSNVAGVVSDVKAVSDASTSAAQTITTYEEANEDIARARQFWDDVEKKQQQMKKEIESAGGYYRYINTNSKGLNLQEQREMKLKLEKFVTMQRPKLEDAQMLSTENIDLRGTISVLAAKTSGNAQIIFKSLDNSIKAVDELNGLRSDLHTRDQSTIQMEATIARAQVKQKALQQKVAQDFGGSWEKYVASLYPQKSAQEQATIAKRLQHSATKEIKTTDTDVGVWESIDLGGSMDALADNITMLGNKTADATAEVYKHGKTIYQGAKDGLGLVGDYTDVNEAEATRKKTALSLQTLKKAKGWDKETLTQAAKRSIRMIDDIGQGRAHGDIEEWQTRLAIYKKKLASQESSVEEKQRKTIPEYDQLRVSQEAAQALRRKMQAAEGEEAQAYNQQFQDAVKVHYKLVEQMKNQADKQYTQLVQNLSVRIEQAYPELRPGLAANTFWKYHSAQDILYRKQVELQDLQKRYQEELSRAKKNVAQAYNDLADIKKKCAEKLAQARKDIAKAEAWENKNARDLKAITHMKKELARITAEVASGDHRWHPMGHSYNEYLKSFVRPAENHLNTIQKEYQQGRWLNQAGILAEIKYRKKEIEEARQVINFDDPRFQPHLKKMEQLRVVRLHDYFI
ncbi:hypothetical protein JWJ90_20275 [Desulfobulbus rhabdoformis]|uniref:hypothetical protein n=1 Tax=Desulfobulbus rhabdoformis TaxID=34032 RepID=UPI00196471C2|nr:hypothetical protein [Desulfobulbus rhabdoformis]MBM9616607.1 hypothetical protein [Desulfobulbus rhabdoformis]